MLPYLPACTCCSQVHWQGQMTDYTCGRILKRVAILVVVAGKQGQRVLFLRQHSPQHLPLYNGNNSLTATSSSRRCAVDAVCCVL